MSRPCLPCPRPGAARVRSDPRWCAVPKHSPSILSRVRSSVAPSGADYVSGFRMACSTRSLWANSSSRSCISSADLAIGSAGSDRQPNKLLIGGRIALTKLSQSVRTATGNGSKARARIRGVSSMYATAPNRSRTLSPCGASSRCACTRAQTSYWRSRLAVRGSRHRSSGGWRSSAKS